MLPDELIYSLLGWIVTLNALHFPRKYLEQLFGTKNVVPCVDLPTHLESLFSRLGSFSPCESPEQLIDIGTLYPYHRPFITLEHHKRVQQILLHGGGKSLKTLIGRVANRFGASPPLRYCPTCIVKDASLYGRPYWRRSHQLPGVICCTKHLCDLIVHVSPTALTDKQRLILSPVIPRPPVNRIISDTQQVRFAKLSQDLLEARLMPQDPMQRRAIYVDAITGLGFKTRRSHIDFDALATAVRIHYGDFGGFVHQDRLLSTPSHPLCWLRTLIDRPSRSSHPICHLLLIGYLFGSIAQFKDAMLSVRPEASYSDSKAKTDIATTAYESCSEQDCLLHDTSLSCREVAKALKLSVTTVVSRRRGLGVPIAERRKYLDSKRLGEIADALASGCAPSSIASLYRVSLSTVYRLRAQSSALVQAHINHKNGRERSKHRRRWKRLIVDKHVDAGITFARTVAPATYAWLYRHDRTWLQRNRPKPRSAAIRSPRVDWLKRDRELCERLQKYVTLLKCGSSRPRISRTLMVRYLGEAMVRTNIDRLPRLHAKLEELIESPLSFQIFRIDRAVAQLVKEAMPLQLWRIQRIAGIRHWTKKLRSYTHRKVTQASNVVLVR